MKDGASPKIVARDRVTSRGEFLSKARGALAVACPGKSSELCQSEITRVDGYDVKKAGFGFRIAKFSDTFNMIKR